MARTRGAGWRRQNEHQYARRGGGGMGGKKKQKKRRFWDADRFNRNAGFDLDLGLFGLEQLNRPGTSTSGFSYMSQPPPIDYDNLHEFMEDEEAEETEDEILFGSIRGNIVGIQYYRGTVNNGEMVSLVREPKNPYDTNAVKVTNVDGIQVGHVKRELAKALSKVMDLSLARVEGTVPFGATNVYSMPVDLSLWGKKENKESAITKMKSSGFPLREPVEPKVENQVAGYNHLLATTRVLMSPMEIKGQLDKLFENLQEGDKTSLAEPAKAIVTVMYPHQKQALHWMIERENKNSLPPFWEKEGKQFYNSITVFTSDKKPKSVHGGILADDMGLGKTLEMIALILTNFEDGKPLAVPVDGVVREPKKQLKKSKSLPVSKSSDTPGFDISKKKIDLKRKLQMSQNSCGTSASVELPPLPVLDLDQDMTSKDIGRQIKLKIKRDEELPQELPEEEEKAEEDVSDDEPIVEDNFTTTAMVKGEDPDYAPVEPVMSAVNSNLPSPNVKSRPRRASRRPAKYCFDDSDDNDEENKKEKENSNIKGDNSESPALKKLKTADSSVPVKMAASDKGAIPVKSADSSISVKMAASDKGTIPVKTADSSVPVKMAARGKGKKKGKGRGKKKNAVKKETIECILSAPTVPEIETPILPEIKIKEENCDSVCVKSEPQTDNIDESKILTTKLPNGILQRVMPDGCVETVFPSGIIQRILPSGTVQTIMPSHDVQTISVDGIKTDSYIGKDTLTSKICHQNLEKSHSATEPVIPNLPELGNPDVDTVSPIPDSVMNQCSSQATKVHKECESVVGQSSSPAVKVDKICVVTGPVLGQSSSPATTVYNTQRPVLGQTSSAATTVDKRFDTLMPCIDKSSPPAMTELKACDTSRPVLGHTSSPNTTVDKGCTLGPILCETSPAVMTVNKTCGTLVLRKAQSCPSSVSVIPDVAPKPAVASRSNSIEIMDLPDLSPDIKKEVIGENDLIVIDSDEELPDLPVAEKSIEKKIPVAGINEGASGSGARAATSTSVARQGQSESSVARCGQYSGRSLSKGPRGTLIICPLSVMSNWVNQLEDHLHESVILEVYMYYGANRITDKEFLENQDIVLTTYSTVAVDAKGKHPLKSVEWLRIVLDEGHAIRNPQAQQTKAIIELKAKRKWVLTGTPIQNSMKDLWSLINFLNISPFTHKEWWNRTIERPLQHGEEKALNRVRHLMGMIALRRTKTQEVNGKPLVELPAKNIFVETIKLGEDERQVYDAMQTSGQLVICKYFNQGTLLHHYGEVLAILMRLRQLCCHPQLVAKAAAMATIIQDQATAAVPKDMADDAVREQLVKTLLEVLQSGSDEECSICLESLHNAVITRCAHVYCRTCIEAVIRNEDPHSKCPLCRGDIKADELVNVPPEVQVPEQTTYSDADWQSSAKVDALMNALISLRQRDPTAKSLVVSQFTSLLKLLEIPLRKHGFVFTKFVGSMTSRQRDESIEEFSEPGAASPTIMLLSLKAGGVGINLIAANNVFLMDPAWNPAAEEQCFDRCHRLGQTKNVTVTKFVIEDSVEERMLALQEKKRKLMQGAFGKKLNAEKRRADVIGHLKGLFNL